MQETDTNNIAQLIYKKVIGQIQPEEEAWLDAWRKEDDRNEALYVQLTDVHFLEQEYRKLKQIPTERPLQDMKMRIARNDRKNIWLRVGVAAVIAGIMLWGGFALYRQRQDYDRLQKVLYAMQIKPGQTKATLVMGGGSPIKLGMDSVVNQRIIAQERKHIAQTLGKTVMVQNNILTTPRGGEFKIVLEDSTEVWLNAESKLIYPEEFAKNERRVEVYGEAYFKVKKDKHKPFLVETDGQLLQVYGTEFNIRSYAEDTQVYTTLVTGQVSVTPLENLHGELVLTPNHQSMFSKREKTTEVRTVNTAVITSWKQGMFVFEEQNLEQIMQSLSRWYDFEYHFLDEASRQTVFMGSIHRYAEFNDVVRILEMSGGLRIAVNGKMVTISSKNRKQ